MTELRCKNCGSSDMSQGFISGLDGNRRGPVWVVGELMRGPFGRARIWGRPQYAIMGHRCEKCGHVDLFAV